MSAAPRPAPDAAAVQAPLARVLRPIVRFCIASGLTFPALAQLLRELYVNVSEHDFALSGKEQTDSRVSLLTGIHRKEVARLRGAGAPIATVPASVSRTSAIVARWLADPAFTTAQGEPLPLPRTATAGEASFEALVASVTRDVRPRAVLDEWLDSGVAALDEEGRVTLRQTAFIPRDDDEQRLYYLGRNLHDHVAAAIANMLASEPPFLERAVHYDGLSPELAQRLEKRARELAQQALQTANREAHIACLTDPGGTARWNFGAYVFTAEAAAVAETGERS
jgi:hypothetical protein